MSHSHHFRVNAGIKNIIGKELIYSDHIAIIELIKNSKDAGATKARLEFIEEELLSNQSTILIADDGKGMTLKEIEEKWLNIAYSEKKASEQLFAGNKGVGRFSCDRLGQKLDLYTKHEDGDYLHLSVDWKKFEDKEIDDEISTISVDIKSLSKEEFFKATSNLILNTGTLLKITELRNSWQTKKMKKLIDELEKFSPTLNQGFFVEIYSKNKSIADSVNRKINNNIFEKLEFKSTYIKSQISKDGKYIFTQLFFQGEEIYEYKVVNPYSLLKNIQIEIHYLDTLSKRYFTQKVGGVQPIEYGSIFLFYNGFRISPYGNRGNDWLGINQRKTQGTARFFGTRDLIGKVFIIDQDSSFSVLSNREGLANTAAFHQLTSYDHNEHVRLALLSGEDKYDNGYLTNIIRQLENFVVDGLDWNRFIDINNKTTVPITVEKILHEPQRYKMQNISTSAIDTIVKKLLKSKWEIADNNFKVNTKALSRIQKISQEKYDDFINEFSKKIGDKAFEDLSNSEQKSVSKIIDAANSKTKKAEVDRDIAEKKQAVAEKKAYEATKKAKMQEETIEQIASQNMFLKVTANQDTDSLLLSMHSILNYTATISAALQNIRKNEEVVLPSSMLNSLATIAQVNQKTYSIARFATLYNFNDKTKKIYADINTFINSYLQEVSNWTMHSRIKIINNLDVNCFTNINFVPLEIMMLLDNIIANSKKSKSTEIVISNEHVADKQILYRFKDDGFGITDERFLSDINLIFDKGETTTKGSGLGLFHVAKTVKKLNGKVKVLRYKNEFELGVYLPCN